MLEDPSTAVSLCAGQGDYLIGAVKNYSQASLVRGRLVEIDDRNIERMRMKARAAGLAHPEMVRGDASDASLLSGIVPADLVLLCGGFGNIGDRDVLRTIDALPQFCKEDGTVIWTRSRREPDFTPVIVRHFGRPASRRPRLLRLRQGSSALAPVVSTGRPKIFSRDAYSRSTIRKLDPQGASSGQGVTRPAVHCSSAHSTSTA